MNRYTVQDFTRDKMKDLKINQSQLAERLGVNKTSVSLFLKGESAVSLNKLYKVIGVPDFLWDGTNLERFRG